MKRSSGQHRQTASRLFNSVHQQCWQDGAALTGPLSFPGVRPSTISESVAPWAQASFRAVSVTEPPAVCPALKSMLAEG